MRMLFYKHVNQNLINMWTVFYVVLLFCVYCPRQGWEQLQTYARYIWLSASVENFFIMTVFYLSFFVGFSVNSLSTIVIGIYLTTWGHVQMSKQHLFTVKRTWFALRKTIHWQFPRSAFFSHLSMKVMLDWYKSPYWR